MSLIQQAPDLLARILDIAEDAIISVNVDQRMLIFNQGAERMFGYKATEVLGQPLAVLLPERFREAHETHIRQFLESPVDTRPMGTRSEVAALRKSGEEFPAEASISKVWANGAWVLTVILRDATERKRAEERVRASLREKEVLLREIHHRVKNNLQVVSSLLSLQARAIEESRVRKALEESQSRVQSMALIHEQLYRAAHLAVVDFPDYIRQLSWRLFRVYQTTSAEVELKIEAEPVRLGVDLAVPCGLIINELVTNSLKYAFPEGRHGVIRIAVERMPDQSVRLTVGDNGIGLPASVGFWSTKTLGLRLVRSLVRQLDGEAQLDGPPGTVFRIRFSPETTPLAAIS